MSMHSARAGFDSFFYWGVFIFVSGFMTFFLLSMISLANTEDEQSNTTMYIGYAPRSSYLHNQGTASSDQSGIADLLEDMR